jgi:hypothetical protein
MSHSGTVKLLYRIVPLRIVRSRLAEHAERCPACAAWLADRDEVRRILVDAAGLGRLKDIWPAVRSSGLATSPPPIEADSRILRRGRGEDGPKWGRLVAASAGIAAAAVLAVFTVSYFGAGIVQRSAPAVQAGFQLHYARVDQRPANTFTVELPEDRMVLIWFESSP